MVFVKSAESVTAPSGTVYLKIRDQDGSFWNIFSNITNKVKLDTGKCYLFNFQVNDKGFNDINLVTPLVNIFQQKALKEVANRNDFVRMYSMAFSYSKDLATAGKIELTEMFDWSDKIYGYFQERADKEMAKLEKPDA